MNNMENKTKTNPFLKILLVLFIMFLCLYSISENGYIEGINSKKTLYTEEQIDKFESDVESGEYIDSNNYTKIKDIDYSNKVSDFGVELSKFINNAADYSINFFNKLFAYLLS